jgi:hypothetical protein
MYIHNFENDHVFDFIPSKYQYINNITLMVKQRNNPRPTITTLPDFGKVPPQANDMEEAVLGAVMLEKEAVITILDILRPTEKHIRKSSKQYQTFQHGSIRLTFTLLLRSSERIMNWIALVALYISPSLLPRLYQPQMLTIMQG